MNIHFKEKDDIKFETKNLNPSREAKVFSKGFSLERRNTMKKLTLNYMVIGIVVLAMGMVVLATGSANAALIFTETKLLASDGKLGDQFGTSVSIDGDRALVGAFRHGDNGSQSGAAYVFVRSGPGIWTEEDKLLASDGAAGDQFGVFVSLSGDRALIGASNDDDKGTDSGSAYVFVRDDGTWTEEAKLLASDGMAGDSFGLSVSIDGDTALIGARGGDGEEPGSGTAYVFVRDDDDSSDDVMWTQQDKLLASDGAAGDEFGRGVSIDGDRALIGAPGDRDAGFNSGSAYVFVRDDDSDDGMWTQEDKLTASDAAAGDLFGLSISLSGDTALIGAVFHDDVLFNSGSAYVFVRNDDDSSDDGIWIQEDKLLASDAASFSGFGFRVSLSGDTALIGAFAVSAAAYLFVRDDGMWSEEAKLTASDADAREFGRSVSIDGDRALVGDRANIANGGFSGAAYIFEDPEDDDDDSDS